MSQVYRPIPVNMELDFLFEDEVGNICFFSQDFLQKIAKELGLQFFTRRIIRKPIKSKISKENSEEDFYKYLFYEIYKDSYNFVTLTYKIKVVEFDLPEGITTIQCFSLNRNIEIIEAGKQARIYKINIKPLLKSYVDNSKALQVAEQTFNQLMEKLTSLNLYVI